MKAGFSGSNQVGSANYWTKVQRAMLKSSGKLLNEVITKLMNLQVKLENGKVMPFVILILLTCVTTPALITEYNVQTNGWRDGSRVITVKYDQTLNELVVRFDGFPVKAIKSRMLKISRDGNVELQVEIAEFAKDPSEIHFKLARTLVGHAELIVIFKTEVETSPDAYRLQLGHMLQTAESID
jgi:hypothetical protein